MSEQFLKRFEIEELKGKLKKCVYLYEVTKDKITDRIMRKRVKKEVEVDAGYMVYTSRGSSIHFWNKKDLISAGFGNASETVDMDSGDIITTRQVSLKELAQANDIRRSINRPLSSGMPSTEGLALG